MTPSTDKSSAFSGQSKARALREALRANDAASLRGLLGPAADRAARDPAALLRAAAVVIPAEWLRHLHADFVAFAGDLPATLRPLAGAWRELGDWTGAEITLRHLLVHSPEDLAAIDALADLLLLHARLGEARILIEAALALRPAEPVLLLRLGLAQTAAGQVEDALAAFQLAEENAGTPPLAAAAGLQFLLALAYLPEVTAGDLLAAAAEWETRHAPPAPRQPAPPPPASRRLRIGYYSPDLRRHSIAHFFLPLLRHHDRAAFEIFVYSDTPHPDALTATFREASEHWRDLRPLPEQEAARLIAADRLDLLVDLAGFFGPVRPRILAARPAPRQAHLLGYHGSTGLHSLDYRFSDALSDPPGREDESSEAIVRLSPGFHCFDPLVAPLAEGPPPSTLLGHITFGSFNSLPKINADVVALWTRLLLALPGSRLLLKAVQLRDPALRETVVARFAAAGLAPSRVDILPGAETPEEHLAAYRRVDIALDPFPCNGTTTTCEALWMGVPVVTVPGARHSARVTSSLLAQIGLSECIASDADDYLRRAARLAADPARLSELRATLRIRLAASSLGDAPAYARRIEAAYRDLISPNT